MLEKIRTAAGTKFAQLILALITVPFALWGVESYLRGTPGQDVVATVAGQKVTSLEFDQAIRQQQERFRGMLGANYDPQMMDTPQMRQSVLDELINQRLVGAVASKVGVSVSDAALAERIAVEPAFQQDGKFSAKSYEAALRSAGFTPASYEAALRADIERSEFQSALARTAFAGTTPASTFLGALDQTREVSVVNLTPEQYSAKVKVDQAAAKAWYDSHKSEFAVPEQAKVEYVELSVDSIVAQSPVGADEVKKFYDESSARYIQPEQRKASHILISVTPTATDAEKKAAKEKADRLFAEVKKNPKTFADVAKANSGDPGSGAQGGDLGFFPRGAMVKPFEEAAFGAKKGDIIGPVRSDFGYHIIMVTDIRPEKAKSLAEATPEIEAELKKQKAAKRYAEVAQIFSDKVFEQSTSLKPIADELKLQVRTSDWIAKGGGTPPLNNPKLNAAIFSDEAFRNKRNTEAVEVGPNTLVAAHVVEAKPSAQKSFDAVEQDIIRRLTRDEGAKLARTDGEAKLKAAQEGKPAELAWPAPLAVGRQNPGGLPPNVISQVLKADVRKLPAYVGLDNPQGGYTVVQISKVVAAPAPDDAKMKSFRQRLEQTLAQQELQSVLDALRKDEGVKISKELMEKKPSN